MKQLTPELLASIPTPTLGVLCIFLQGINCKKQLAKNTYYTQRRILKAYGFDITPQKEACKG